MRPVLLSALAACLVIGCTEPIDLPDDPASGAAPVGRRTLTAEGVVFDVFYPAPDRYAGLVAPVSLSEWLGDDVVTALGPDFPVPVLPVAAATDAPLRNTDAPWPVVLFSHGLAAYRLQSLDLVIHLASRGFVVLAPDHAGRNLADFMPCVFTPPLDGCNLTGNIDEDPGPEDLTAVLDWALRAADGRGDFAGRLDVARIAAVGHSAGARSVAALASDDDRIDAVVALAGVPALTRDVPSLSMAGACDAVLPPARTREAWEASPDGAILAELADAGHMAFTDICALDLVDLSQAHLVGRPDVSDVVLDQLLILAGDGCADQPVPSEIATSCPAWADTDVTHPAIRATVTAFLEAALAGVAPDLTDIAPGVTVEVR